MQRLSSSSSVFLLLTVLAIPPAIAQEPFVQEIDGVIGKMLANQEIQNTGPVIVGGFLSNPQQDLHAAPAIKRHIIDCLHRRNIKVEPRGPYPAISGTFGYAIEDGALIDIEMDLTNRDGERLQTYPVRVKFANDNCSVLNIAAPSAVKLDTKVSGYDRGQAVVAALKTPEVVIQENYACAPGGHYSVEIVCDNHGSYVPVPIVDHGGFGCVEMNMGQAYRIIVKNNSPYEAVAAVTIDGLDVFAFADQKSPGFLIPPNGGTQEIKGWYINNRRADAFVVGRFAETPAAQLLGSAADAGVICVQFSAAWIPGNRPSDEGGTLGGGGVGTKRGPAIDQHVEKVPREVGKVREVVCIRYGVSL